MGLQFLETHHDIDKAYNLMAMNELARIRLEGWKVNVVREFPTLADITDPVILGSFSWTCQVRKEKWLQHDHAYNWGGGYITPGDMARDYLTVKGHRAKRRRMTTKQYQDFVVGRKSAPLYAEQCELEEAVYIDLKSAYWSILKVVGWNVEYCRKTWLGVGDRMDDFPFPDHKLARNCLVTVGVNGNMNIWDGQKIIAVKKPNPFTNMVLYSLVMDVLNAVATDMKNIGARYVHTDGYIFPAILEREAYDILDGWGLKSGEKFRGRATIRGIADYDIGGRKSKLRRSSIQSNFNNVERTSNHWLKRKFSDWAGRMLPRLD